MQLVMFDIDGTLVDTAGLDGELYARAVRDVLGVDVDRTWASYTHVTDSGVLDELLRRAQAGPREAALRARVQDHFVAATRARLERDAHAVREIRGAARLVERLLAEPAVRVAVATGGWRETALLKLRHVGIDASRLVIATASDAMARTAIMKLAEQRATRGGAFGKITYLGDGPWDRRASAELGYEFIGVGRDVEHTVRFDDLVDEEAIVSHLGI